MAENKKSFLLYCDIIHTVKKLSDEKAGILFKHILSYVNDEHPESDDVIIDLVFEPIKQGLKRDLQKYLSICERNKKNGESGGRPKKKPKKPSGLSGNPKNPNEPKKADNDIDNDIDNSLQLLVVPISTWRDDFSIYKKECTEAFSRMSKDSEFKKQIETLYPEYDFEKSLASSFLAHWMTEEGWVKKVKSGSESINWKSTIVKTIKFNLIKK